MKSKLFFLVALAVGMVFMMSGCKDDECFDETNPDCVNYDPCHDVKPANADFGMFWSTFRFENGDLVIERDIDTIYLECEIRFIPLFPADNFIWYIGDDTSRVNVPLRKISFAYSYEPNKLYTVTRISEMNPSSCLKENELLDVKTKQFYTLKKPKTNDTAVWKSMLFWGTWEGYNTDNPDDKFMITFGYINDYNLGVFTLAGLPQGMPLQHEFYKFPYAITDHEINFNYKLIHQLDEQADAFIGNFGLILNGWIEDGQLVIQYEYNDTPLQQFLTTGLKNTQREPIKILKKTFIGRKISNEVLTQ